MLTLTGHQYRRSVILTHNSCNVVAISFMICPVAVKSSVVTCSVDITLVVTWSLFFYVVREVSGGVVFHLQLTHCFFSFYPLLHLRFSSAKILLWFHVVYFFCTVWGTRYHCLPQIWILKFGSEEQDCVRILSCRANLTTRCYVWLLHLLIFLIIFI